ncbi:unnamed protein product [Parascedosporium putredinis]|uniref:Alpha/beta hydrolase fold-3 domain-containing protein n=1 Tax=Parascedosporium putredinis TaxID=1442378 RepID=A0A9P1H8L6_9PEZI|nr:unnamed protein product [Parascedosporium putredinis]CAI7999935.1 unnamed protein product [Parascedosporium putredinis]
MRRVYHALIKNLSMHKLSTTTVSLAVMPTVIGTFFPIPFEKLAGRHQRLTFSPDEQYLNRQPLHQKPTAHLSYHEGLHLIKAFLEFSSHHTVEELQAFTAQWVPHPQWVKVKNVEIPEEKLSRAASILQEQLGEDGIRKVGGREWWQWRKPDTPLKAEWIEMREDYNARKAKGEAGNRVMLYVHGGAYYFGSVDEHRYQMQRHARKLKARVFAPEYRLAPQFPFPCGLHDCLAAYLYLLEERDPSTIVLAGDSAGGGMVMSLLVTLRDRGIPLPAGARGGEGLLDYIPPSGFHHKPSMVWPPPNEAEMDAIKQEARERKAKLSPSSIEDLGDKSLGVPAPNPGETQEGANAAHERQKEAVSRMLTVDIDDQTVKLEDQIQMYTTNELLSHPLVSPVLQPSLGGLPPLLIMVGGAEMLRDEQIFLAHKCAMPKKYCLPPDAMTDLGKSQLAEYPPTPVQLQVWDDLCHVAPTLSFTRPAKYMYRSIAQFSAWALARAQNTSIQILDDDAISVISTGSETEDDSRVATPKPATPGESREDVAHAHDKATMVRESKADQAAQVSGQTDDAESTIDPDHLTVPTPGERGGRSRSGSHRVVIDENQTGEDELAIDREETLVEDLLRTRQKNEADNRELLGSDYIAETGVAGSGQCMVTLHSDSEEDEVAGTATTDADLEKRPQAAQPTRGEEKAFGEQGPEIRSKKETTV